MVAGYSCFSEDRVETGDDFEGQDVQLSLYGFVQRTPGDLLRLAFLNQQPNRPLSVLGVFRHYNLPIKGLRGAVVHAKLGCREEITFAVESWDCSTE